VTNNPIASIDFSSCVELVQTGKASSVDLLSGLVTLSLRSQL
jgi:hypothetical protein